MAEKLTLFTVDQYFRNWTIREAKNLKIDNTENGFSLASWDLPRDFSFAWDDIGLGFQVFVYNARGDLAWNGRLESIEPSWSNGQASLVCTATGYWSTAYDLTYTGTLSTSATPEAMITSLLGATYLPWLSSSASGLLTTGLTARAYSTPNGGTDDVTVGDIILAICKLGTSTSGQRVIPAVWDSRLLVTYATPVTPTARYIVKRRNIDSIALKRTLSSVYNRVIVRYKDVNGVLQRSTQNDTTSQSNLGIDFSGGGTLTNLIRTSVRDITGLQNAPSSAAADQMANAVLQTLKRVRNDAQAISISKDWVILDVTTGQEIPNWSVRAGQWIQIPDLFPRGVESGTGTNAGDQTLQTLFYITQCSFDVDNTTLTITPESASQFESVAISDITGLQ